MSIVPSTESQWSESLEFLLARNNWDGEKSVVLNPSTKRRTYPATLLSVGRGRKDKILCRFRLGVNGEVHLISNSADSDSDRMTVSNGALPAYPLGLISF